MLSWLTDLRESWPEWARRYLDNLFEDVQIGFSRIFEKPTAWLVISTTVSNLQKDRWVVESTDAKQPRLEWLPTGAVIYEESGS